MPIILTKYKNTVAITTATNKVFYMSVKQFLNAFTCNKEGAEGSELLTNGAFTSNAAGWTLGAGWAWASGHLVHTPGSANTVTQAGALTDGERYVIRLTIGGTVGTVTVKFGGTTSNVYTAGIGAVKNIDLWTTNASKLILLPSSNFDGTIDAVSMRAKPYRVTLDTDRLDESNIPLSAWTIAGITGMTTIEELGDAIKALVKYN